MAKLDTTRAETRALAAAEGRDDTASGDRGQVEAMKSEPGPPMTLGNAAAAGVRLIVWCLDCHHQVEPAPAGMAERYGAEMTVLDWRERLLCSRCGSRNVAMVVSGTDRR
jgi:hypothetical protein